MNIEYLGEYLLKENNLDYKLSGYGLGYWFKLLFTGGYSFSNIVPLSKRFVYDLCLLRYRYTNFGYIDILVYLLLIVVFSFLAV